MLTVVAIIGVLALVMVPAFMNFYQSNKVKSSMRSFTSDLRQARQMAISRGLQTMVTFGTGTTERTYDYWQGDKPFASTTWRRLTQTAARPMRALDPIIYFPADDPLTPQTFTDTLDCSSYPGSPCTAGNDGKLEVMFFPDGRAQLPTGLTAGSITIKTDLKLPTSQYTINISPSGRVQAQ